jgi:subtilisin-like proprotein convertase family protein
LGGTYAGNGSSPFAAPGTVYPGSYVIIFNNAVNTGTIDIPDATPISNLVVRVDAYHTYLGDLSMSLTHNGTTVPLFDRVGVAGFNATGRPGDLNRSIYAYTDLGTSFWNTAYVGGKDTNFQVPGGLYTPSGASNAPASFAPFVGQSAQGTWTLSVVDAEPTNNSGHVYGWTIEINPDNACAPSCPGNECGSQDYNGDGDFGTDQDIEAFFACLGGTCCATCFCQGSDFNGDGDFGTDQDIEAFFRVLAGGTC